MRIINFGQVVDLEHGTQIAHQFTIQLSAGQLVQVKTDEGTVQQLLNAVSGNGAAQSEPPTQDRTLGELLVQEAYPEEETYTDEVDPGEMASGVIGEHTYDRPEPVMGVIASETAPRKSTQQGGLGQPAARHRIDADGFLLPTTPRTVPTDSMGYPIVQAKAEAPQTVPDDNGEDDGQQI